MDIQDYQFDRNDWAHLHDCIFHVTGSKTNQKDLENIFLSLPIHLKNEAHDWGMNDTVWRGNFIEYYEEIINSI